MTLLTGCWPLLLTNPERKRGDDRIPRETRMHLQGILPSPRLRSGLVGTVPKAKMLFTDVEQFKSFWVNGLPKCFSLRADTRAIINEKRGVRRNLFKINDLIRFTQTGLRQSLTSLV
jgi:hypothetical protein